ncbi:major facilitator superfamily domain-containing protein [Obelidium mucronatum]|nr:major facilitator superfamily domain-containing protein [Obelidium mucronatum]
MPASETTPLLQRVDGEIPAVVPTPLPLKQFFILSIVTICEPIQGTILFPFVYFMIKDFGVPEHQIGWYVGLITSLFSLAQVLSSVPIGYLSDKIGRRPVLLLGLAGNCVSSIMFGMSKSLPAAIVSRFLLGLVNGNIGVAKSMTGEITDKTNRPLAFSLFGVCFSLGSVVGPMLGGTLSNPVTQLPWLFGDSELFKTYPYLLPCLCSSLVSFSALVVGWFYLEETLGRTPAAPQRRNSEDNVSIQDSVDTERQTEAISSPPKEVAFPPRAYPAVLGLGLLALTAIMSEELYPLLSTLPKEGVQTGFGFSAFDIGISLSIRGVFTFITQVFVFPRVQRIFGSLRTVRIALLTFIISFTILPFLSYTVKFGPKIFWSLLIVNLAFWTAGSMSTFTSMFLVVNESAEHQNQLGRVNGMAQMAACMARTIGPLIGGGLWGWTLGLEVWWGKHLVYGFIALVGFTLFGETFWIQSVLGNNAFSF